MTKMNDDNAIGGEAYFDNVIRRPVGVSPMTKMNDDNAIGGGEAYFDNVIAAALHAWTESLQAGRHPPYPVNEPLQLNDLAARLNLPSVAGYDGTVTLLDLDGLTPTPVDVDGEVEQRPPNHRLVLLPFVLPSVSAESEALSACFLSIRICGGGGDKPFTCGKTKVSNCVCLQNTIATFPTTRPTGPTNPTGPTGPSGPSVPVPDDLGLASEGDDWLWAK
jgi:hypothetical protein